MSAETVAPETEMGDSTVTLGDVQFDPVATNDFRLSIEGTSNTGKSNTLAVLLEDLADVTLPTLIIERLGALTPVRFEDEDLIVVGARDEEGIDLPVGLGELDHIGEWVLDHGRKILLDISTYADYEDEKSREHLAAAKALRSLNDRAHEKYRAGDRTKSLLVVDEAHILAPKDSAPEPELDDYVKRCRGQLIKAATEGGNKGISIVTAYQRRAFLHNGVIQLCADFVAHRPGDEDLPRTAKALRCDEGLLAGLGTGEIVAKGETITGGDLVGPTTVRKRRSPDPREETFELPEASGETEAFLEEIREEVEAERERRQEREDELERLRAENERLRDRVEEVEQELDDTDRLASALENLRGANGGGAAADVGEGVEGLQERVEELKEERDELLEDREIAIEKAEQAREEVAERQERIADLEADVQELRSAFEAATESVEQLAETFDVAVETPEMAVAAGADEEDVDADLAELRKENERLRERLENAGGVTVPTDYQDFVQEDVVQEAIENAKGADHVTPRYVKGVVAAILQEGGPVEYDTIAEMLGVSDNSNIGKAATALEARGVVEKVETRPTVVDFDLESVDEIKERNQRRREAEQVMEEI